MLFDTSAWIELFGDTEMGRKAKKIMHEYRIFTSSVSIAEIAEIASRKNVEFAPMVDFVKENSVVIDVDRQIAELAGALNHVKKKHAKRWGMIDSVIVATSVVSGLDIVTKDRHFADLKNVVML